MLALQIRATNHAESATAEPSKQALRPTGRALPQQDMANFLCTGVLQSTQHIHHTLFCVCCFLCLKFPHSFASLLAFIPALEAHTSLSTSTSTSPSAFLLLHLRVCLSAWLSSCHCSASLCNQSMSQSMSLSVSQSVVAKTSTCMLFMNGRGSVQIASLCNASDTAATTRVMEGIAKLSPARSRSCVALSPAVSVSLGHPSTKKCSNGTNILDRGWLKNWLCATMLLKCAEQGRRVPGQLLNLISATSQPRRFTSRNTYI